MFIFRGRRGSHKEDLETVQSLERLSFDVDGHYDEFTIVWQNGYTEYSIFDWKSYDELRKLINEKTGNELVFVD